MKKLKELNIYQVIVYEHLKENMKSFDDLEEVLIDGIHHYFNNLSNIRIYDAYWKLGAQQTVEVIFFISKHLLSKK